MVLAVLLAIAALQDGDAAPIPAGKLAGVAGGKKEAALGLALTHPFRALPAAKLHLHTIHTRNKYGSVQELRSTFRQFYFVLVIFHFDTE